MFLCFVAHVHMISWPQFVFCLIFLLPTVQEDWASETGPQTELLHITQAFNFPPPAKAEKVLMIPL